jgi:hypothetical protein
MFLTIGPFFQVVVPTGRQRMKAEQSPSSQEPTALSLAVLLVTSVAPVVRPEHPATRTAAVTASVNSPSFLIRRVRAPAQQLWLDIWSSPSTRS